MTHSITTAEDLRWLLTHTQGFRGGQITDVHVAKRRMFDEESGRDVMVGSTVTVHVTYSANEVLRAAKLTMQAVTDLSLFEQEGGDWTLVGPIQVELSEGKLRFWFDPHGNLYVVCEDAIFEEVSLPHPDGGREEAVEQWLFQADSGEAPTVDWLLSQLDQLGMPCVWKAATSPEFPGGGLSWQGELLAAHRGEARQTAFLAVQAYGPIDGGGFGIRLEFHGAGSRSDNRLLSTVAHVITHAYAGTCLAGQSLLPPEKGRHHHR
ncbi:MAG: hypothetical protein JSR62_15865 [Nitrospira sp.]|nr:hypothetical protein [Nitrospira sp.]